MSTSDGAGPGASPPQPGPTSPWDAAFAAAAADPALIGRIANELFAALPPFASAPATGATPPTAPPAPASTGPMLDEGALRAIPSTLASPVGGA
ncbi:MAG TPA: hypothetical protein VF875_12420, partial [Anaeromyxobacter sp.]